MEVLSTLRFILLFQYFFPDNEEFRLGIQKCRKTIEDAVADPSVFRGDAMDSMFKLLRNVTEMRSMSKFGGKVFVPKEDTKKSHMSFAGVTTLVESKENKNKIKGVDGKCSKP